MRVLIGAVVGGLLLAGCQTLSPEQQADADGSECVSYGMTVGTDAYANCRLALAQERRADLAARRRAASAAALQSYQNTTAAMNAVRPQNCTTTFVGRTANTTCY